MKDSGAGEARATLTRSPVPAGFLDITSAPEGGGGGGCRSQPPRVLTLYSSEGLDALVDLAPPLPMSNSESVAAAAISQDRQRAMDAMLVAAAAEEKSEREKEQVTPAQRRAQQRASAAVAAAATRADSAVKQTMRISSVKDEGEGSRGSHVGEATVRRSLM